MNFKERMSKQNNSIKVLLRKLKRHDTIVVAIAVVIALALSGGLIYLTTPVVTASTRAELQQTEKENNEKTIEKLDELSGYLNGLDKSLEESQKSINSFNEKNSAEKLESLKNSEKNTEKITNTVNDKVIGLGNDLSNLHNTITNTQTNIEKLKETIEKESGQSSKERSESMAQINTELENIKSGYDKAQHSTKELIDELQKQIKSGDETMSKDMAKQYRDLLDKLGEMNTKFEQDNSAAIDSFKNELGSLEAKIGGLFEKLDAQVSRSNEEITNKIDANSTQVSRYNEEITNKIDANSTQVSRYNEEITNKIDANLTQVSRSKEEITNKIDANLTQVNNNIDNKFDNMNGSVQGNFDELKNYIGQQMKDIDDRFNAVFTSVSDGKKLLASALLTKNIVIKEDATFREIAKAIENVPTQIVLDRGDVAGKVEYDYHFHTDGTGKECNESTVGANRKGGCYNTAVTHTHTSACYKETTRYTYWTNEGVVDKGFSHEGAPGVRFHLYYCPYCNQSMLRTDPGHIEITDDANYMVQRKGRPQSTEQVRTLACGLGQGQLMGYKTSCGMTHGQVTSARITFADDYASYNTEKPNASGSANANILRTSNIVSNNLMSGALFGGFGDVEELPAPDESSSENTTVKEAVTTDNTLLEEKALPEEAEQESEKESEAEQKTDDVALDVVEEAETTGQKEADPDVQTSDEEALGGDVQETAGDELP